MKTSIKDIPTNKQEELNKIIEVIKNSSKNITPAHMIILYWSYARWDFVESDINYVEWHYEEYRSDFDILVITHNHTEKNLTLEREIKKNLKTINNINTPVSLIVENIKHINKMLEENRYFYLDIKREWIKLYDSWKYSLENAKVLTEDEKYKIKKEDFEFWFFDWLDLIEYAEIAFKKDNLRYWVFTIHQSIEMMITAYMLVKTGYKPKTHDLEVLNEKVINLNNSFKDWFDLKDENESHHFDLLKKAYVEARYSKDYTISKSELNFLIKKASFAKDLIFKLCREELNI